jgi:hypothetical protein
MRSAYAYLHATSRKPGKQGLSVRRELAGQGRCALVVPLRQSVNSNELAIITSAIAGMIVPLLARRQILRRLSSETS